MFKIATKNVIAEQGLMQFGKSNYVVMDLTEEADAILCRSANLHQLDWPETLKVVGRAGAGVNNIPLIELAKLGIPVLNTPGANANAVKELALTGMLLASRHVCNAWQYVKSLSGDDKSLHEQVEKGKKQFRGVELPGKTLGVIGLGAVGVKLANTARALGMKVIGYDPAISIERAWQLSSDVKNAQTIQELFKESDFISVHVPLLDQTRGLINQAAFDQMKSSVILLNFARQEIVNEVDLLKALSAGKVASFVCDFPSNAMIDHPKVIALPHLGASTEEAEINCAVMIVNQVKTFLETGDIINSVNFPSMQMPRSTDFRLAIANDNVPNMVGQMSTVIAKAKINITDMLNKSRGEFAYTLFDIEQPPSDALIASIEAIPGVLKVRVLGG